MPYWRTPWLVRRAVDLILAQTFKDLMLVVVNDGDAAPWNRLESIKDERLVRFDLEKNRGPYYANQVVLDATSRPLFTVHDADDWSQSDRLEVLHSKLGKMVDVAVDGFTRHGTNGQTTLMKTQPELVGHSGARSLWHIAHHKGLWRTESLRPLGMGPRFRVGWDTYLMHFAALALKVEWVKYYGYNQERQKDSLITSPQTGPRSKLRAEAIAVMGQMWNEAKADPSRIADICAPTPDIAAVLAVDADRLRSLL